MEKKKDTKPVGNWRGGDDDYAYKWLISIILSAVTNV